MAKFLHSRAGSTPADEILDQNILTVAQLRSLIAGDFCIEFLADDFLLLHEKGIFVLRQCHRNGIISGEESAPLWTDMNYLGDAETFTNPLAENARNIDKLSRMLKLPPEAFHGCVLFDVQCELRRVPQNSEKFSILRIDQLEDFFADFFPKCPVRYTHTQLEALKDIFLLVSVQG